MIFRKILYKDEAMSNNNSNIKEIVDSFLKENGYDGLYNEKANCGCEIDNLVPYWNDLLEDWDKDDGESW